MHAAGGKTMLAPTTLGGLGVGPANAPDSDYMARRFGMNPPAGVVEIRRDVERSIHAAAGIPPVLVGHSAPGQSLREGWRQFHTLTLEPLAGLVSAQLSEALGVDVRLDMRRARAADVATLARAAGSLVSECWDAAGGCARGRRAMRSGGWSTSLQTAVFARSTARTLTMIAADGGPAVEAR